MRKVIYFAVFEPSNEGTFGVYFPDLAGCISMDDNFQHAQNMAEEALGLHLWGLEKDGDKIPSPSQRLLRIYLKVLWLFPLQFFLI